MRKAGVLTALGRKLRVKRQGGYAPIDALVFLLLFFAAQERNLRSFAERMRPFRGQLASLAGRREMMHQSSLSRLCSTLSYDDFREHSRSLLLDACDFGRLVAEPSTGFIDGNGCRWDIFDFDPAALAIRRRGLPIYQPEEGPAGDRRTAEAKAGHCGRHRGEVQIVRMLLRHAGTGLWMNCEVHGGNGDIRGAFQRAVATVSAVCRDNEIAHERAIVRCDGAHGHVPYITACKEAGVQIVTRLSHYGLLQRQDILDHLETATWYDVEDSASGPRRQATDLGEVMLMPDEQTRKADQSPYESIKARVIVMRGQVKKDRGAGIRVDGEWYELLGTTLPAEHWPAEDVATLYYGRAGMENGINQAHDLCNLDRVFCHELAGQEFVTIVGLLQYNLQITLGTQIEGLPGKHPVQRERPQNNNPWPTPNRASEHPTARCDDNRAQNKSQQASAPHPTWSQAEAQLGSILDQLPWSAILERKGEGWRRESGSPLLYCPEGRALQPGRTLTQTNRSPKVVFYSSKPACLACARHGDCAGGKERRRVTVTVDPDLGKAVDDAVVQLRDARAAERTGPVQSYSPSQHSSPLPRNRKGYTFPWEPLIVTRKPTHALTTPLFLPAEARKVFREEVTGAVISVDLTVPPREPPVRLVADSSAQRQHRRKTWQQRLEYNAPLPGTEAKTTIRLTRDSSWLRALYEPVRLAHAA